MTIVMEIFLCGGQTYHIDLGHGVDQNDGEDCDCQPEEERPGEIPDYTSEMEARFLYCSFIRDIFMFSETILYSVSKPLQQRNRTLLLLLLLYFMFNFNCFYK